MDRSEKVIYEVKLVWKAIKNVSAEIDRDGLNQDNAERMGNLQMILEDNMPALIEMLENTVHYQEK